MAFTASLRQLTAYVLKSPVAVSREQQKKNVQSWGKKDMDFEEYIKRKKKEKEWNANTPLTNDERQ